MQQHRSADTVGEQRRGRRPVAWTFAVAAVLSLSVSVAACGSDDSDSSSASASGSTATTTSASAGGDSAVVADAKKFIAQYQAAPTTIGIDQKLKGKPAPGKNVVFLGTNDPNNVKIQKKVKELSQLVGWSFSLVGYDPAKPNTFQSAIDTALSKKANYLVEAGLPLTPPQLQQVKDAGAKWVINAVAPIDVKDPILVDAAGPKIDALMGKILANFFIADSNGKGNAIMEHVPSYPILGSFADSFASEIKKCTGCKLQRVDVTLPQLAAGKVPSLMVSALRKNPDANYLVFDVGPFAGGVTSALKGAGLAGNVKIIGEAADEAAIAALKDGSNTAWTAYDSVFSAYEDMQAMFLDTEGSAVPADVLEVVPTQLLTTDNVPDVTTWSEPKDADAQFKALWGVG